MVAVAVAVAVLLLLLVVVLPVLLLSTRLHLRVGAREGELGLEQAPPLPHYHRRISNSNTMPATVATAGVLVSVP